MKNRLSKIVLSTLLVAGSLMAESSDNFYTSGYSLIGVEGGFSGLDVERNDGVNPATINNYNMYHGGLKIGAQSDNYRLFLSARYFAADDFDYATTYGVEAQYLFHVSSKANIYMGINTGIINMRYLPENELYSRTISEGYFGGDIGANVHLSETIDLELGVRVLALDASNTIDNRTYTFDNMITAYTSVIFKFKMD